MFEKMIYVGMPVVAAYHLVCGSVFLNTAAEDAKGLEKIGNFFLAPAQFLLDGKIAIEENGEYRLQNRFDYHRFLPEKSAASVLALPIALPLGLVCKAAAYASSDTGERHDKIVAAQRSTKVTSLETYYQKLGIPLSAPTELVEPPRYVRRPGSEKNLPLEKELLRNISRILQEEGVPFWVDAGTCLGAYRYGGSIPWDYDIDIASLLPEFHNIWNALKRLDPKKYHVQDWSSRCCPDSYIRVYIPENRNYLDIYFYEIDPERKTITYLISNIDSSFLPESWKEIERHQAVPSAYETILPLKRASFDGIEVFVPQKTKKYLQERYGENIDPIRVYNEKSGEYEKDLSHPYWLTRSNG